MVKKKYIGGFWTAWTCPGMGGHTGTCCPICAIVHWSYKLNPNVQFNADQLEEQGTSIEKLAQPTLTYNYKLWSKSPGGIECHYRIAATPILYHHIPYFLVFETINTSITTASSANEQLSISMPPALPANCSKVCIDARGHTSLEWERNLSIPYVQEKLTIMQQLLDLVFYRYRHPRSPWSARCVHLIFFTCKNLPCESW